MRGFLGVLALLALAFGIEQFWFYHRTPPAPERRALFPGAVYDRVVWKRPRPVVLHLITLDLTTPGLHFKVTPGDTKRELPLDARTTSAYLKETGAQIAINADFFYPWVSTAPWDYYPHVGDPIAVNGRACSEGNCYTRGTTYLRLPSLLLSRDNRAVISKTAPKGPLYNVVSGNEMIMREGKIVCRASEDLHPRTAVGLDAKRQCLFLLVVDGRQPNYSEGVTTRELAEFLYQRGAVTAINLDGGGSTTMATQGKDGTPQVLNCTIDNHIPGRERPVANHLVVFLPH